MANALALLSQLQTGRSSSTVEVRLLRFWEARNVCRGGEIMGVDMLLLDSQSTMMPATVNVNRLSAQQPNLEAGSVYSLSGFEVTNCNQKYRLSDSSLLIWFTDLTSFTKVTEPRIPIPHELFRFRNHGELLGLANSNNQLPDLIGELIAVKSSVSDDPHDKNRVMATIKMENDTSMIMSLFDAQAVAIHDRLENLGVYPRVVVATSVNPKMVGGRLILNATSGTHIYFDKETGAGESLFHSLVAQDTGLVPVASLPKSYAKGDKLSISELNDFVTTAPPQDINFICNGRVTGVKLDNGWCYISCINCSRKLQRSVSTLTCLSCNNNNAVGVLRYRVEMSIADETGEALFVGFDGVMANLHNMRAYEAVNLLAVEDVNPEESEAPPFVRDMEGKAYTFHVRVGSFNFTANHKSFIITRIISEGERLPQPELGDDGGDDDNGDDRGDGSKKAVFVSCKMESGGGSNSGEISPEKKKARNA